MMNKNLDITIVNIDLSESILKRMAIALIYLHLAHLSLVIYFSVAKGVMVISHKEDKN